MADRFHRKRHTVGEATLTALRPLFRYSYSRDAYILRVVGARSGPVLRPRHAGTRFVRATDQDESVQHPDPRGPDRSSAA
jgi:hypothetical protein